MASISQIATAVSGANAALSSIPALGGILIASPQTTIGYQPQPNPPLASQPALVFNYEGEQTATLSSDITDHYVEDNTAIQDQIALKPILITTHGFIGDLNDVPPNAALAVAQKAALALTPLSAYSPQLSITALNAYNAAVFAATVLQNTANTAVSAWNTINGNGGLSVVNGTTTILEPNQTPQQQYFQQFLGYWNNRTLFTIQTPWCVFQNMAIQTLRAIQDETTKLVTDFEVTFKLIRFASSQEASQATLGSLAGRAANQNSQLVNLGTSTPAPTAQTVLGLISGLF